LVANCCPWKLDRSNRFSVIVLIAVFAVAPSAAQVTVSPSTISFGNHYLGQTTNVVPVTVTNTQAVPLQISKIVVAGGPAPGDFTLGIMCPQAHPLAAGQSCTINVGYKPTVVGANSAKLSIIDGASNSPQIVTLSGNAQVAVTTAPSNVTFPSENLGTTSTAASIAVTNNYAYNVTFSSVAASGDFAIAGNTCTASVKSKAQCTVKVTFTPTALGTRAGTLTITDSAPGSPTRIALSGTGNQPAATWSSILHVIIIFQENRTPDNLFQDPVLIARGADIASSGLNSSGQLVPLTPIDLGTTGSTPQFYDVNHSHNSFLLMYDGGKMDGADKIPLNCYTYTAPTCPFPNAQFRYVLPSDVAPYFQMAEQYTFGDRMFQTNEGPSFPAHQFILAGTGAASDTGTAMATGNISNLSATAGVGCLGNPGASVSMLDISGKTTFIFPCFEHKTLTDLLENAGVSWRYYAQFDGSLWTAPNAIQHICGPNVPTPNATACTGADWASHVMISADNAPTILEDIADGQLAGVSWVTPTSGASDHAGDNNGSGPSWVASIVNAVGASPYWSNTAIIITWDDWGGWYDHVAPQVVNDGVSWGSGSIYGFRVPLIVMSPYAKRAYISHVDHDFGSILHFVEQVFDLPSLGWADARADDLSDCFDFTQTPPPFKSFTAPISPQHFINNTTPRTDPDDD